MTSPANHRPDPEDAAGPPRLRVPQPRTAEIDLSEMREPSFDSGDLFPDDRWPRGRPEYVIVVDQLRGWRPGQPSLAELLEPGRGRGREPDLEAEP